MRAIGAHHGLSPVLDICRDPRWGRLEETYGEDPYLVTQMGVAFIRVCRGTTSRDGVVGTAKHFVGYGASEGGMNWAPAHLPERELRDVYLRPFEAAVRDAGLASVMNGYHELDGVPCGANGWLLTDLLRGEWGFDGTVRVRLLRGRAARRVPPRGRVPDRGRGRRARGWPRRRAARHRLLRRRARSRPSQGGLVTDRGPRRGRAAGARRRSSGSVCSSGRSSTSTT